MYKRILPEAVFLSFLPNFQPTEQDLWMGASTSRRGRKDSGCCVLDALVDWIHEIGYAPMAVYEKKMGVPENSLDGFLRVVAGRSFKEWVYGYLILAAQELLKKTKMESGEIARLLHFSNATVFSRWFRQQTGRQPIEWRIEQQTGKRHKRCYDD